MVDGGHLILLCKWAMDECGMGTDNRKPLKKRTPLIAAVGGLGYTKTTTRISEFTGHSDALIPSPAQAEAKRSIEHRSIGCPAKL
jgi:hypothetical protein